MSAPPREITELLMKWRQGDTRALDDLMPRVYQELRRLARHYMAAERRDHTLQTSALVHEAYLRLIEYKEMPWQNRAHFFAVAAQAMRRILVDHARAHGARKRGRSSVRVPLDEAAELGQLAGGDLLALDEALTALSELDPRKGQVVEMRYFAGMSVEETAAVLGISAVTVMRDWRAAKAWLLRAIVKTAPGRRDHDA